MPLFPGEKSLGNLTILEVYLQYNGPKLFSCVNELKQTFLALWVDEEEDFDLWLYISISIKKLNLI